MIPRETIEPIRQEYSRLIPTGGLLGLLTDHRSATIGEPGYVFRPIAIPDESDSERESRLRQEATSADALTAATAQYAVRNIELARDASVLEYIEIMKPVLARLSPYLEAVLVKTKRTRKEYCADYNKFRRFWSDVGISVQMPVRPELVALYIMCSADDGASYAALSRVNTAIDNAHDVFEHRSPSGDPIVKAALKYAAAIKRATPEPPKAEAA